MINDVDLVLYGFMLIGFFIGLYKGVISLVGMLVSVWAGLLFSGVLSLIVSDWLYSVVQIDARVLYFTSFLLSFLIISIGVGIITYVCSRFIKMVGGGWINTLLGGFVGVVLSTLIASTIINLKERFLHSSIYAEEIEQSQHYTAVREIAPRFVPYLSDFFNSTSDRIADFVGSSTK